MKLEKLDQEIFAQVTHDQASLMLAGSEGGGRTISAIVITQPCGCVDAMDVD